MGYVINAFKNSVVTIGSSVQCIFMTKPEVNEQCFIYLHPSTSYNTADHGLKNPWTDLCHLRIVHSSKFHTEKCVVIFLPQMHPNAPIGRTPSGSAGRKRSQLMGCGGRDKKGSEGTEGQGRNASSSLHNTKS